MPKYPAESPQSAPDTPPIETYATTDLYLAAYLVAIGHPCRISDISPTKVKFSFNSAAEESALDYYAGATIPAIGYAEGLRRTKSAMNSRREVSR